VTRPPVFPLPPNRTIGIVGGGQLGRMTALAAARLGYRCHILTPEPESPAGQVSAGVTLGDYEDPAALAEFASAVDVITFEFENVSAAGLDLLAALKPVRPAPSVLRTSQDRIAEKSFLNGAGAPTAPWRRVASRADLDLAAAALGLPAVLKTTRLGYDGKGQSLITGPDALDEAFASLAPKPLVLEGFVDFACEISVIAARGEDGRAVAFDVVENRHRHHILDLTLAPAPIPEEIAEEARAIALRVAEALDLVGLIAVEMFVTREGGVLVNEIAPRPHNSGHWTIDACPVSQFELFVRAVAGLPLPLPTRHSDAVMKNLVGPEETALWPEILSAPGLIPHLYGKQEARAGRKMGHVTRLFPRGALPGSFGITAALGPLAARAAGLEEAIEIPLISIG
jgi:5-(carboxyamino)imidazole ribonucleotide synthase